MNRIAEGKQLCRRLPCHAALIAGAIVALLLPTDAQAGSSAPPDDVILQVIPNEIRLTGAHARHALLLEMFHPSGTAAGPVSEGVAWRVADRNVADLKDGIVVPVGDGETELIATWGKRTIKAQIGVSGLSQPDRWEFRRHVLPVLAKAGCNQGACHGALAGKGGFRLSLRGYDPFGDYFSITQESRGRRVEPSDAGRSLLLAKPTGLVPHRGGLRLHEGDRNYQVLSEWLLQGADPPTEHDAQLVRVEVLPRQMRLSVGQRQPLLVHAYYADGRVEDVTEWAKFTSAQAPVAQVNDRGMVEVVGFGEGAISVWFSSQIVVARITSPYPHAVDESVYREADRSSFLDQIVLDKLRELRLEPSPRCSDHVFLRRAYLDTIGLLPSATETSTFLRDRHPDKRRRVVDQLLARPEFVDFWAYRWSDVLAINGRRLRAPAVKAYYQWIRRHVANDTPWDQVVREIVTARGATTENGETNFYALNQTPEEMAENACQAFLGLSINCAKCHNHPLEKWTNNQYYAMANLFARVRAKGWAGDGRGGSGLRVVTVSERGELIQPLTGKPQPPTPLDGQPLPLSDPSDRREHLADWLTSPDNPYFGRSIANRIWANFFGVGIVSPVDDLRISNPASNELLLSAAHDFLVANDFHLKALIREILISETYQRASEPLDTNRDDQRFFARYYPRRLMAEPLFDAIAHVTDVPGDFSQIRFAGMDVEATKEYPKGTRALQLYDSAVDSSFLSTFGRNRRDIVCECERSNTPTMVQVLHLHNGDTINQRLRASDGWVASVASSDTSLTAIVEQAYLRALSRYPADEELDEWSQVLTGHVDVDRRELVEDIYWSVMSSREFLFQH